MLFGAGFFVGKMTGYDIAWDYELGGAPLGAGSGDQILGSAKRIDADVSGLQDRHFGNQ